MQLQPEKIQFASLAGFSLGADQPRQELFLQLNAQVNTFVISGVRPVPTTYVSTTDVLGTLEQHGKLLSEILNRIKESGSTVYISTFTPDLYVVKKPIPVHIESSGDGYMATFFDANISTSGEMAEEAFSNLKSLLTDTFDYLSSVSDDQLGTEPARQVAVLREFIGRID